MIGIRGRARLTGGKANFQALAEYILREGKHEDKHEPILGTWSQGLSASDAIAAGREMSAVAGKSRVKDDPIYHLILSWAPGEQPSADQAKEAVKMQMSALGFDGHQYLCALQNDGKSGMVHLHALINRVNPESFKAVSPQGDYQTIRDTCRATELEQGWQYLAQGQQIRSGLQQSSRDAERYMHISSLERIVKTKVAGEIEIASQRPLANWEDIHRICREHKIEYIEAKGEHRGVVLVGEDASIAGHRAGIHHKDLIERLGAFVPDAQRQAQRKRDGAFEGRCEKMAEQIKDIKDADWSSVHEIAKKNNIEILKHARGGGLQIRDLDSAERVSAARVDRSLALSFMEGRFGKFVDSKTTDEKKSAHIADLQSQSLLRGMMLLKDTTPLLDGLTQHQSVFSISDLDEYLDEHILDPQQREQIAQKISDEAIHLRTPNGIKFTTNEVMAEESDTRILCARMAGETLDRKPTPLPSPRLTNEEWGKMQVKGYNNEAIAGLQKQSDDALNYACDPQSKLKVITGAPGVGKTHLINRITNAYTDAGYKVRGVSVANSAVRVMHNETPLSDARSMAKELASWNKAERLSQVSLIQNPHTKRQKKENARRLSQAKDAKDELPTKNTVYIVDEASTLGTKSGRKFLDKCSGVGATVILIGDDKQHQSASRGSVLEIAQKELSEHTIDLSLTRRQKKEWQREATVQMRKGDFASALKSYEKHGALWFAERDEAIKQSVEAWRGGVLAGKETRCVAVRNADMLELGGKCHDEMRAMGRLQGPDHEISVAFGSSAAGQIRIAPGDELLIRGQIAGTDLKNGSIVKLEKVEGNMIKVRDTDGKAHIFDAKEHNAFHHAYATSSYVAQGRTDALEIKLFTKADSRRSALVDMTRHTHDVILIATDGIRDTKALVKIAEKQRGKEHALTHEVLGTGREIREKEQQQSEREERRQRRGRGRERTI